MGCECGKDTCGCETPTIIHLADEYGNTHAFYVADRLQVDTRTYAFLVSTEDQEQYALLRVDRDEDGHEYLVNIEDEDEWSVLEQAFFNTVEQ